MKTDLRIVQARLVARALAVSVLAAFTTSLCSAGQSTGREAGIPFDEWTRLRYTTSKLLVFTGELTMARAASTDRITVKAESQARLLGSPFVDSWSVSTMDRKTGRPIEFLDVRPGKRAERWVFGARVVEHTTLKPHEGRPDEPIEKWRVSKVETLSDVESSPVPKRPGSPSPASRETGTTPRSSASTAGASPAASRPGPAGAGQPDEWIHDYISMIVRLQDLPLHKIGDETKVKVSTSRGPAPMRIRVADQRTSTRILTDLATGKSQSVELEELRLRVTPLAGSPSDTRGFLNMEGETEMWVDARTRTLTEISGNVPKVPGRVVITLAGYR